MDDPRQTREQVTLGVDTHAELHVAAVLDERGRLLGTCTIPTTSTGFAQLVCWVDQYGELAQVGMEGTGSYGAGLARWPRARQIVVIEVDRRDRRTRRRRGKSDPVDAEAAAGHCWQGPLRHSPRAALAPWRWCARCAWHVNQRSKRAHKQPMSCMPWS